MPIQDLTLDPDPELALESIRSRSTARPVLVFKKSPTCPVSFHAEAELAAWRAGAGEGADLALAVVDVLAERPLARGLTAALGVRHESPQALWFADGNLLAHGSHGALNEEWFEERLRAPR